MQFIAKSPVPYVSVEVAAEILRMSRWTIYRNLDDVPHIMVGNSIRIPVEFLMLEPPPVRVFKVDHHVRHHHQPFLPFDVKPDKRWRNNLRLVQHDPFGDAL